MISTIVFSDIQCSCYLQLMVLISSVCLCSFGGYFDCSECSGSSIPFICCQLCRYIYWPLITFIHIPILHQLIISKTCSSYACACCIPQTHSRKATFSDNIKQVMESEILFKFCCMRSTAIHVHVTCCLACLNLDA